MKKITDTDFIVNGKDDLELTRYNGGWTKEINGIDKSKSNGYSLLGSFIDGGKEAIFRCTIGKIYLDCDIEGSRKNHEKYYRLFHITTDGTLVVLKTIKENKTWAIDLWPEVEKFLGEWPKQKSVAIVIAEKKATENALKELSSDSLIIELQNRGYDISSLVKHINIGENKSLFRNIEMDE